MPADIFPVAERKLYHLSVNRNPALTMTANRMAQEETETKINNYNHVKGFLNKTQYDKTLLSIQQTSVSVPNDSIEVLACKVECKSHLTPIMGGFVVEKFVATMYHCLQFA
ncbi:hypothetical protein Q9233_013401 [Columba guinea]|nr:hypothetical protein Q9233_013401 [Columba guinea]